MDTLNYSQWSVYSLSARSTSGMTNSKYHLGQIYLIDYKTGPT